METTVEPFCQKRLCQGTTAAGKPCVKSGWIEHQGSLYCALHDPLKRVRAATEWEYLRTKAEHEHTKHEYNS